MAAVAITFSCARAMFVAVRRGPDEARIYLAQALLFCLSLMLAGTLLRALTLGGWNDIGFFAVIFAMRTLIKLTLRSEATKLRV